MFCGIFSTLLIKETKRKTLEELAEDDDYVTAQPASAGSNTTGNGGGVLEKNDVVQTTAGSV